MSTDDLPGQSSFFNPYQRQAEAIRNRQRGAIPAPPSLKPGEKLPTAQNFGPEPTNVMEMLVTMEVVKQVQTLPKQLQEFIKITQVKAYALNILPPLYVTSAKGWERYWDKGEMELKAKIQTAVRQGIAAVQRDPLRETSALPHEREPIAEATLSQIKRLLHNDSLTWYTVIPALKHALRSAQHSSSPGRTVQGDHPVDSATVDAGSGEAFDWDAHPLHQRGW
jgi:hypothetical protein